MTGWVAQDDRVELHSPRHTTAEVVDPQLVLEMVLVEQGALQQFEVSACRPIELPLPVVEDVVLEQHRLEAYGFAEIEERLAPFGVFEPLEDARQLGVRHNTLFVRHDCETEVDREHNPP